MGGVKVTWETYVVIAILVGMVYALIKGGDKLDHWTFRGYDPNVKPPEVKIYGMTLRQIRKLRAFYINQTGDVRLEGL